MMTQKCKFIIGCFLLLVGTRALAGGVEVVGDLTRAYNVEPGKNVRGKIVLRNATNQPREVRVYQTDYLFFSDGRNLYGDPGSVRRSNSAWITFSPQQLVVPPSSLAVVYYAIEVPTGGNLHGTYWSMLMIEPLAETRSETAPTDSEEVTLGIHTVMRYGVQMVTNAGESGKKEISIVGKRLVASDNVRVLQLDIENNGDRWLTPSIRAELYDHQGAYVGSFDGGAVRIFPGCSVRRPITLEDVGAGRYNALVILDNGDEAVWGAQYVLDIT